MANIVPVKPSATEEFTTSIKKNKKVLMGGGAGAVLGFLVGGPIGALIGAGVGGYGTARYSKTHGMTPERKKIFDAAMKSLPDPIKLRKLAEAFEKEGLPEQATALRRRAKLRELPIDVKKDRQRVFRQAIKCDDPEKCLKAADAFEKEGYTSNAAMLRQRALALKSAKA